MLASEFELGILFTFTQELFLQCLQYLLVFIRVLLGVLECSVDVDAAGIAFGLREEVEAGDAAHDVVFETVNSIEPTL